MASGSKKGTQIFFSFLSKVPANEPLQVPQQGPLWRERPAYSTALVKWTYDFHIPTCLSGAGIAQPVQRLATGWKVRESNPGGARFSAPIQTGSGANPAYCTKGNGSFPGVKVAEAWCWPHPLLVPRLRKRWAIPPLTMSPPGPVMAFPLPLSLFASLRGKIGQLNFTIYTCINIHIPNGSYLFDFLLKFCVYFSNVPYVLYDQSSQIPHITHTIKGRLLTELVRFSAVIAY
jgi:hypothetical protein